MFLNKIKNLVQKMLKIILRIGFFILSPKLFRILKIRFNQLYSMWKSNEFKKTGNFFNVQYPLYLHGGRDISIGEKFISGSRFRLEAYYEHLGYSFQPKIVIGDNVSFGSDCHLGAINEITIDDGVLIGSKVFITDHYHGEITTEAIETSPSERKLFSKGPVKIEKNVWIGEGVVILPNVIIGENSIIGANSVVSKSVPKNSVVGGNPAKLIRML